MDISLQSSHERFIPQHGEEYEFITPWEIKVNVSGSPSDDSDHFVDVCVAVIEADELRLKAIEKAGADLYAIADSDSMGLEDAVASVFHEDGVLKRGFPGNPNNTKFVFVHRFELHPRYSALREYIWEEVCREFGTSTTIVTYIDKVPKESMQDILDFHQVNDRHLIRDNSDAELHYPRQFPKRGPRSIESDDAAWYPSVAVKLAVIN